MATLQSRLKDLRKAKSQSQRQIVEEINSQFDANISLQNYANWERSANPKLQDLILLADYYDVTLDYLVGREDNSQREYTQLSSRFKLSDAAWRGLKLLQDRSTPERNLIEMLNTLLENELQPDKRKLGDLLSTNSKERLLFLQLYNAIANYYADMDKPTFTPLNELRDTPDDDE